MDDLGRQMNFLASCAGGHTTMTREQAKKMLLDTGGQIFQRGTLVNLKVKNLGAGVVHVSTEPAYRPTQTRRA